MPSSGRTLFCAGFSSTTRAFDLAQVFERHGPLIRCDIPAPKPGKAPFAFVEFQDDSHADRAFDELRDSESEFGRLTLQVCSRW